MLRNCRRRRRRSAARCRRSEGDVLPVKRVAVDTRRFARRLFISRQFEAVHQMSSAFGLKYTSTDLLLNWFVIAETERANNG